MSLRNSLPFFTECRGRVYDVDGVSAGGRGRCWKKRIHTATAIRLTVLPLLVMCRRYRCCQRRIRRLNGRFTCTEAFRAPVSSDRSVTATTRSNTERDGVTGIMAMRSQIMTL